MLLLLIIFRLLLLLSHAHFTNYAFLKCFDSSNIVIRSLYNLQCRTWVWCCDVVFLILFLYLLIYFISSVFLCFVFFLCLFTLSSTAVFCALFCFKLTFDGFSVATVSNGYHPISIILTRTFFYGSLSYFFLYFFPSSLFLNLISIVCHLVHIPFLRAVSIRTLVDCFFS